MYLKAMERLKFEEEYEENITLTFPHREAKSQKEIMRKLNKKISEELDDEFEIFKPKKEKKKPHTKEEVEKLLKDFNGR